VFLASHIYCYLGIGLCTTLRCPIVSLCGVSANEEFMEWGTDWLGDIYNTEFMKQTDNGVVFHTLFHLSPFCMYHIVSFPYAIRHVNYDVGTQSLPSRELNQKQNKRTIVCLPAVVHPVNLTFSHHAPCIYGGHTATPPDTQFCTFTCSFPYHVRVNLICSILSANILAEFLYLHFFPPQNSAYSIILSFLVHKMLAFT
jgi:hypothetical protein